MKVVDNVLKEPGQSDAVLYNRAKVKPFILISNVIPTEPAYLRDCFLPGLYLNLQSRMSRTRNVGNLNGRSISLASVLILTCLYTPQDGGRSSPAQGKADLDACGKGKTRGDDPTGQGATRKGEASRHRKRHATTHPPDYSPLIS